MGVQSDGLIPVDTQQGGLMAATGVGRRKTVYVRAYSRFRFNRWENVTDHFRSHPQQLSLF